MSLDDEELAKALKKCESEAIHLIGSVQPHGVLLVLDNNTEFTILQSSKNVESILKTPHASILGKPLHTLLGHKNIDGLVENNQNIDTRSSHGQFIYSLVEDEVLPFLATLHTQDTVFLLELEPIEHPVRARDIIQLQLRSQRNIIALQRYDKLLPMLERLTEIVYDITGYDRVMIYHFDVNWEGEVVAETRDSDKIHSYLGHRFPAGDIPPQARELYQKNIFRMYVDIDAKPSLLEPEINPKDGQPLNLSSVVLRSFSPVHIEYLRNMGVRASMSLSIVVNGKLWGLIACHHNSPKNLEHSQRESLKFIAQTASVKISELMAADSTRINQRINKMISLVLELLQSGIPPTEKLAKFESWLLPLINASGIVIRIDGESYRRGNLPSQEHLDLLFKRLFPYISDNMIICDHFPDECQDILPSPGDASGLLAVIIDKNLKNGIFWFRPEKIHEVKWAGKPDKIFKNDRGDGLRISPRDSFETWREYWRGRCEPWNQEEITLAKQLTPILLQAFRLLITLSIRKADYRSNAQPAPNTIINTEALLVNLPVGIVVHDNETKILYANPKALKLLRLTEQQALGRQALKAEWNLIDENSLPLEVKDYPVNRVLNNKETLHGIVIGIVDDKVSEPTWVALNAYQQIDASGEVQVIVSFIDVSERERIPFRQIVDMSNDAIVVTEASPLSLPGPRIVYSNKAFSELSGYQFEEVKGLTPRILQTDQTSRTSLNKIRKKLELQQPVRETLLNIDKSGKSYWVEVSINPLFDHQREAKYFVSIERDVTDVIQENLQLKDDALRDSLTGLLNRRGFFGLFNQSLAKQVPLNCCVIAIDIDYFKKINDTFGHGVGDDVLVELATLLQKEFRRHDLIARFGGEEFIVLTPQITLPDATSIAERFRQAVERMLKTPNGKSITISLGVSQWQADDKLEKLIERADNALYDAKRNGRNQVVATNG